MQGKEQQEAQGQKAVTSRIVRGLTMSILAWLMISVWSTEVSKPVFSDCYERATWDGKIYHYTGEWKCLQ
jgi:hypothetical protein